MASIPPPPPPTTPLQKRHYNVWRYPYVIKRNLWKPALSLRIPLVNSSVARIDVSAAPFTSVALLKLLRRLELLLGAQLEFKVFVVRHSRRVKVQSHGSP